MPVKVWLHRKQKNYKTEKPYNTKTAKRQNTKTAFSQAGHTGNNNLLTYYNLCHKPRVQSSPPVCFS